MYWSRLVPVLMIGSIALPVTMPAHGARTVIDNSDTPLTPCAIGTPCNSTPIGFNVDFGFGVFNSLYIYDNGLISIGSEIPAGADLTSLASIGVNVLTAGYSPGMTLTDFAVQDPGPAFFDFPGQPVFRVRYEAAFGAIVDMDMEVSLFDLGGNNYVLQYNHGPAFDPDEPDIAEDAYLGYSFTSGQFQTQGLPLQAQVRDELHDFRFFFGTAVPEPASWLTMIAGFGLAGAAMRRRTAVALARQV